MPERIDGRYVLAFGAFVVAAIAAGVVAYLLGPDTFSSFYELGAALFIATILLLEFIAGTQYEGLIDRLVLYAAILVGGLMWPVMLVAIWGMVFGKWRKPPAPAPRLGR